MTALPTVVALLGDGDPLLAFTQLQDRILQTIGQADDSLPIQAAAYSLGLASDSDTHLGRLTDFGADFGFEARQAQPSPKTPPGAPPASSSLSGSTHSHSPCACNGPARSGRSSSPP